LSGLQIARPAWLNAAATTEDLRLFADKVKFYNEAKKQVRG